ncbi:MAG TPA: DNA-binding domain-containing protein [Casimicrobiaceae bacterium]|nr:DNA-binding domain-containing protein [Casimicrobiaceae bacterium]
MSSLAELQRRFADALYAPEGATPGFGIAGTAPAPERMDIYRRAIFANYRKALTATYPAVQRILGESVFADLVDAYVRARPSMSGDLNDYGDTFGAFLAQHPSSAALPHLPDLARLEWAIDEVSRAADDVISPERVLEALAAVAPERLPGLGLRLAARCRLVASPFPILRIWQANAPGADGDPRAPTDSPGDALAVRRDPDGIVIERLPISDFEWLAALAKGATLAAAMDAALKADPAFDLGGTLHTQIGNGTIAAIVEV